MSLTVPENTRVIYDHSRDSGNITNSYNNEFNISVSDDRRQLLEWLSPLASRERHQAVRDTRVDGVGDWLLRTKAFHSWYTLEDPAAKGVLLCSGDPGVGKTYLSSLVIDTLCAEVNGNGVAVVYVYCDFSTRNVQSASTVLGSVLRQVVGALPDIPNKVKEEFEKAKKQVDSCGLRLPQIHELLVISLSRLRQAFICIDALDEFPTKQRGQLWDSLRRVVRECQNTRLFLTGRPLIVTEVGSYIPEDTEVVVVKPALDDIGRYIEMRLKEDLDFNAMDNDLRAEILKVIPERIGGIFLLVGISMDAILAEPTVYRRRKALRTVTSGRGLQDAYDTTLDRIRQLGGSKAKLGIEALMWISHSQRPLESGELCHALGVELKEEDFSTDNVPAIENVLSYTFGLATIDKKGSTVRLFHLTLQEYLGEHPTLFITAHSMMAATCLIYLNSGLVRALPANLNRAPVATPLLEYSTCFWGTHAAMQVTEPVKSLALRFLGAFENHVSAGVYYRKNLDRGCWNGDFRGASGLHCIAFLGIVDIAIAMLEMKGWSLNGRDSEGNTPLMWAAGCGNGKLAELLLGQEDIEPDTVNQGGRTALSIAAESGNECVVKLLMKHRDVILDRADNQGRTPFSYAAESGDEGIVELLLARGDVNANSWDNEGQTPLFHAVAWGERPGDTGIVKQLLERGDIEPDLSDNNSQAPLLIAAVWGYEAAVKLLLQRGDVNPNLRDKDSLTPMLYAVTWSEYDTTGVVKLLLERGDTEPDLSNNDGQTTLSLAAELGYGNVVKLLLQRGDVNPNSRDKEGRTPMWHAVTWGDSEETGVVKLLLEREGIEPDLPDNDGRTPLSIAARWSRKEEVKVLLVRGDINPNSQDKQGRTPMWHALRKGECEDVGVVELLLEREDIAPDLSDNDGRTPLSFAAEWGYGDVVRLLLEHRGVNPNSLDKGGRTPLSYVANRQDIEGVMRLLLGHKDVDPNLSDDDGRTPLSYSARSGHEHSVKLLLERSDVSPDLPDSYCHTPLFYAVWGGHGGIVKLLLQRRDVNPNSLDKDGRTPLSLAAVKGDERVVKILLKCGDVNPNISDMDGRTPLSNATTRGHKPVVKLLLGRGDVIPYSPDTSGKTPLLRPATGGH